MFLIDFQLFSVSASECEKSVLCAYLTFKGNPLIYQIQKYRSSSPRYKSTEVKSASCNFVETLKLKIVLLKPKLLLTLKKGLNEEQTGEY